MSNKDRYDRQLKNVVDLVSQSIVQASDEEVLEDARLSGVDLDANATRLAQLFTDTAKAFQKRKFLQAQETYSREIHRFQQSTFQLPQTSAERRALLQLVVAQQAQIGSSLTAKFRDFENISDADLTSLLEEFAVLGLIPDTKPTD